MNEFELLYRGMSTSTLRNDAPTIHHPSPAPSLSSGGSASVVGRWQSSPAPIDKATCITLVTNALRDARERNRDAELRGVRGNNSPDLSAQQQFYQRLGVTIDLSHQRISDIPLEMVELIKDEIER
jgi:hypothetical protein